MNCILGIGNNEGSDENQEQYRVFCDVHAELRIVQKHSWATGGFSGSPHTLSQEAGSQGQRIFEE